jgi:DNA invertase Pin-like site-specific DNA recombinase
MKTIQSEIKKPTVYGYSRISTKLIKDRQTHKRQIEELQKEGCEEILFEEESGAKSVFKRPILLNLLNRMEEGDRLVVAEFSRLTRDMRDIQNIIDIMKEKKTILHIVGAGIYLDTRKVNAVMEMQFNLFATLAQFEKSIISERVLSGLEAARANGRVGGRKVVYTKDHPVVQGIVNFKKQNMNILQIAKTLRVSRTTVYKIIEKYPELFDNE